MDAMMMTTKSSATANDSTLSSSATAIATPQRQQQQLDALHRTCADLQSECDRLLRQNTSHQQQLQRIDAKWQRKLVRQQTQQAGQAAAERARYHQTVQHLRQTLDDTRLGYEQQLATAIRQPMTMTTTEQPCTPVKMTTAAPEHQPCGEETSRTNNSPPPNPQTVTFYSSSDNDDDDDDDDDQQSTQADACMQVQLMADKPPAAAVSTSTSSSLGAADEEEQQRRKRELEHDLATIQGRYTINPKRVIAGGFSAVFLAQSKDPAGRTTKDDVAIKYCPHSDSTPIMLEREISALERFQGVQGIAQLREHNTGTYGTFLVMERCPGQDLERYVSQHGPVHDLSTCREIARQLFTVLQHMHVQHVMHRDIKPANLMFHHRNNSSETDGNCILTTLVDLGVCYVLTPGLTLKNSSGTPGYWAPEVHDANSPHFTKGYDTAADLYSAGCTLYFIVHGVPYDQDANSPWDNDDGKSSNYWLQHLLQNLTNLDPKARMTAEQVLQHPFTAGVGFVPTMRIYLRSLHTLCMAHLHYLIIVVAFLLVAHLSPQ